MKTATSGLPTVEETTMKAIVYHEYGLPCDVLELEDIAAPAVHDDEVLVRVEAAGVNPGDWDLVNGTPYILRPMVGVRKPKKAVLGLAVAGQVEAIGENVSKFQPGDEVYAGISNGGFAEYASVSEDAAALVPANLTYWQSAAVPVAAVSALQGLRDAGRVQPGQKVLVNGASGGVGTFAVQIAKHFGAEVTGVCSTKNVDLVRSIGADHVVDYTQDDFTAGDQRYDLILDAVGNHSISEYRRVMKPKGTYGAFGGGSGHWLGPASQQLKAVALSPFVSQKLVPVNDKPNQSLVFLSELLEAGEVTPVIDRTYPLSEAPDAMCYLEEGHARGKIVITVAEGDG
jgi:NADPH:quinone reductase-like Zn-dependent oxidoreductase